MKSQLCSVLFAMVVSVAACGGKGESTPTEIAPVATTPPKAPVVAEPKKAPIEPTVERPASLVELELPKTYADALARGTELVARGDHAKARELLALAAKLDKKQSEPHIELARSYIATNERANAIKSATKAVKLAPESSQAYNTLGRAELLRHSYDAAIEAFRQATELNPDNIWAWNNLGYTHLLLKQYQEAADALVEATSRKGTTGYMWNNLGTAYEHLDQLDDAREAYENGGKLGSAPALASRKRLEGVDTIVVMRDEPAAVEAKPEVEAPVEHGYDNAEPMPEPVPASEDAGEPAAEPGEDAVVEPKIEESGVDVKAEAPSAPALDGGAEVHDDVGDETDDEGRVEEPAPGIL